MTPVRGSRIAVVLAVALILFSTPASLPPSNAQAVQASGFTLVSSQWGTPSGTVEAGPGQQDTPLTVVLQYYYYNTATSVSVTIGLPIGFTDTNGNTQITSYVSGIVPSGTVLPFTFYLDIAPSVVLGTYSFPITVDWGAAVPSNPSQSQSTTQNLLAMVALKGRVQLQFAASQTPIIPGAVTNVPVTVTNTGTGPASNISLSFSPSSSALAPAVVSVLNTPPQIASLAENSSAVTSVEVYAPSTSAGSSVTLAVTGTYTDAYGDTRVVSGTVGTYVTSVAQVPVTISSASASLNPGQTNNVTLIFTNVGTLTIRQITISVNVPPEISLLSRLPITVSNVPPGGSVSEDVLLFVSQALQGSSSSVPVTISYTDAAGGTGTITQNIGFYIVLQPPSPISIRTLSSALTPGGVNNVTLVVSNVGNAELEQLVVQVTVPPSVSLLSRYPETIPALQAGSSVQLAMTLFVSSAMSGSPVTVTVAVTYTDAFKNPGSQTQNLGLYVPIAQSASIGLSGYAYTPSLIYPGTTVASLQVSLVNSGTTTASNINATLIPTSPVYSISKGSLNRFVGFLPNGQTIPLSYTIGIFNSSKPLNCSLTFSLQYSGGTPLNFTIPFTEQSKADFQVVGVSAPAVSTGDGADQIIVTLRNTGGAAAQSATFSMQPSNVFEPSTQGSFNSGSSIGVGTVPAGGTADLTVVIQVNSNLQPADYPLVFHAVWSQLGASSPFTQDITLRIPVQASVFQMANGVILNPIFLVVVVILIALFVVVRRGRRRRRRAEPAAKEPVA